MSDFHDKNFSLSNHSFILHHLFYSLNSFDFNGTKSKELSSIHDSVDVPANQPPSENVPLVKKEPLAVSALATVTSAKKNTEDQTPAPVKEEKPTAALPATTAKPAPSAQSREKAASYLSSVKRNLKEDGNAYQRFTAALKKYQKENNYEELTQVLVDVFFSKEPWHPLLRGFYHFLRQNHKAQFDELCLNLTGQRCEAAT